MQAPRRPTIMARVTTKTGDEGFTDLLGSVRVPKYHRRPEAFGTVDEVTSILGLARAHIGDTGMNGDIRRIQQDLYKMMAELATPPENYAKVEFKIKPEDVLRLENASDELKAKTEIGSKFVIPGDTREGAFLDVARSAVRRAERLVTRLYHEGDVTNVEVVRYLNRLSDVLFIMARHVDQQPGAPH
jgi:cob(I)alamin adenosyltransferase